MFAVRNVPGSLHRCLGAFAARGLNLSRLESRPWVGRGTRWEYLFWVDLDGDPAEPEAAAALEALGAETELVRYPRDVPPRARGLIAGRPAVATTVRRLAMIGSRRSDPADVHRAVEGP